MIDKSKRIVLITGVSGGIGRATANVFKKNNWNVVGIDIQEGDESENMDIFINADISSVTAVSEALSSLSSQLQGLDALVNNAAFQVCKPLDEMTLDDWDRVMATNLRGPFWFIKTALPLLRISRGAVVNVSSVHAVATSKHIVAYATSKGGLCAMTRAMAMDLAEDGIRVNTVLPGAVDTPMLREGFKRGHLTAADEEAQFVEFESKHVLKRVAQPMEVANAILFLSDNNVSSYINGESLVVDGGVTARLSTE